MDFNKYIKYKKKYLQLKKNIMNHQKGGILLDENNLNYIKGCLYGNAIGDTMGLFTEFILKKDISKYYPDSSVFSPPFDYNKKNNTLHHQNQWKNGIWTDDTNQMICILNSILEIRNNDFFERKKVNGIDKMVPIKKISENHFANNLSHWIGEGFKECGETNGGTGVGTATRLWVQVVSDKKTLYSSSDIYNSFYASIYTYLNNANYPCNMHANGAVMRTGVIGTWQYYNINKVFEDAITICKSTHASPKCIASCMFISGIISKLVTRNTHTLTISEKNTLISEVVYEMRPQLTKYIEIFNTQQVNVINEIYNIMFIRLFNIINDSINAQNNYNNKFSLDLIPNDKDDISSELKTGILLVQEDIGEYIDKLNEYKEKFNLKRELLLNNINLFEQKCKKQKDILEIKLKNINIDIQDINLKLEDLNKQYKFIHVDFDEDIKKVISTITREKFDLIEQQLELQKMFSDIEQTEILMNKIKKEIGDSINIYIDFTKDDVTMFYDINVVIEELERYINMDITSLELDKNIGYTYKPVGCAMYCFRQSSTIDNFELLLINIIKEGGDADTNCAVVGAVLGAYYGYEHIQSMHSNLLNFNDNITVKVTKKISGRLQSVEEQKNPKKFLEDIINNYLEDFELDEDEDELKKDKDFE
jgi:ADP-ribosylglycohydrolase